MQGYVYILEVRDILLPVCKIGMTTRTPEHRVQEINQGATGDFLWDVAHKFYVNDCVKFEKCIHQQLSPLRQKRREFFNLSPDDAHKAVLSILERLDDVVEVLPLAKGEPAAMKTKRRKSKRKYSLRDQEYARWLDAFNEYFNVLGQPFGQTNKPLFGISDGVVGVQWNLLINTELEQVELGVNLEGTQKTGGMLITDFLLSRPSVNELKNISSHHANIFMAILRDAWQAASRPVIEEQYVGGSKHSLSELNESEWQLLLDEALSCLDEQNDFRKRKLDYWVTLKKSGVKQQMPVSPHLQITTAFAINADPYVAIKNAAELLLPVREWVLDAVADRTKVQ